MESIGVLEDPKVAAVALEPLRAELLALLAVAPASAATLAGALGQSRQKVRYHLHALEEHGLVLEVGRRRHGGITERVFAPSASSYVVSPSAMGRVGADPTRVADRLSSSYLLAVAARAVREVGALARAAREATKAVPTMTIDTEIRFGSTDDRAAFADELSAAVVALAGRYHDEGAVSGRWYRIVALSHPRPTEDVA
ncbi:MAG: helix-turn-helix domain-containing protein [Acidimicrobiales bacterium]